MIDNRCTCVTCDFWGPYPTSGFIAPNKPIRKGRCHRFPPMKNGHLSDQPETMENDWCGEHSGLDSRVGWRA